MHNYSVSQKTLFVLTEGVAAHLEHTFSVKNVTQVGEPFQITKKFAVNPHFPWINPLL
jgi:hypothetical protein